MVNKLCYVAHRTCVGQGTYPTDGRYTLIETTMIQSSYLAIGELYSVVSNPADDTCKVCLAASKNTLVIVVIFYIYRVYD